MCCCSEIVERRRCCSPAPAGSTRRAATGKRHVRRADSPSPDLPPREDGDGAHLSSKLIEPSSSRRRRLRPALCATVTNLPPILRRRQAAREAVVDPVMLALVKARPVSLLGAFWHIRRETGQRHCPGVAAASIFIQTLGSQGTCIARSTGWHSVRSQTAGRVGGRPRGSEKASAPAHVRLLRYLTSSPPAAAVLCGTSSYTRSAFGAKSALPLVQSCQVSVEPFPLAARRSGA
jgi:hypothetical protein